MVKAGYFFWLLLGLILSIFLLSCERELQNIEKIRETIIGQWEWIETQIIQDNTGAGKKFTPTSEGYTKTLSFEAIGRLDIFINDTVDISYNYEVIDIDVIRDERKKDIWLKITDLNTDTVVMESSLIRITKTELFFDRELQFEVETYHKK